MKSNRRDFFQTMGVSAAGIGLATLPLSSCASADQNSVEEEDGQQLFIGDNIALTDTEYGKVRGYILNGIYHFLGMPYGAPTSGVNRFMPPQKPEPWNDVYPALWWGNSAPQMLDGNYSNKYGAFRDHWNYDDVSEDCLRINVFTPSVSNDTKRPVLLWMHGGGFTAGNGIEHDGYNGENLARFGDVVFCSVNHRLGPLGFSNFAGVGGDKYSSSGNVGVMDLVAALEWVRDNISNFGGDPDNVTIMGQSGGGAKVCTVSSMPSAKGLVHKAVVLSGATTQSGDKEFSEKLGSYILKEAGLSASQIDKLQEMPWKEYYALANRAAAKLQSETGASGMMRGFSPVMDGEIIPQHPYYPEANPYAAEIPMIICSTTNELGMPMADASLMNITMDQVPDMVRDRAGFSSGYGDKSEAVVEAYAKAFPDKKPIEIYSMVSSSRQSVVALADAKSKQTPPVYVAWFGWQPPLFDNRMGAFHCVDICFWFYNTDKMITHTGGGARPRNLSQKMAGSLLHFMKTGDPNGGGLPQWDTYSAEKGELIFLDDQSEMQMDPDREARKSIS